MEFSPELVAGIRRLCREEGTTSYVVMLAAFHSLLHRYAGLDDILVGTPVSGRGRAELGGLIGFFVNTVALRLRIDDGASFRSALRQEKEVVLDAVSNQDVPFEQVVEAVSPVRDPGWAPLIQVFFVHALTATGPSSANGLELLPIASRQQHTPFDLLLSVDEQGDRISASLTFATTLFDPATAERLLRRYLRFFEVAVGRPDLALARLPLLDGEERAELVERLGRSPSVPIHEAAAVHELFMQKALEQPSAVALIDGQTQVTYGELATRVDRLAAALQAQGVGPEVSVAVCMDASPHMVTSMLAVWRAGGVYVPIDATLPPERMRAIVKAAGVRLLLGSDSTAAQLEVPGFDPSVALEAAQHLRPVGALANGSQLAYVIFTSGSTGVPKGVMVEHRGLVNSILRTIELLELEAGSVLLQTASIGFDGALCQMLSALVGGASLALVSREQQLSTPVFTALARSVGANVIVLPTPALALLDPDLLPGVRTVAVGGEACPATLVERWASRGSRFINLYGPSEVSITATSASCTADGRTPPIGRPLANLGAYVLDASLDLAPTGVEGELYLGGVGVARGYLGDAGLTAERFLPDPFSDVPGARMYRTGDLCRWRPDGQLEYCGRRDSQVKLRGHRIELAEIEETLRRQPGVERAVVLLREDRPGDQRLVAYVVLREGIDRAELRTALQGQLPAYMVPSAIVALDALPLTRNDKVDRKALAPPAQETAGGAARALPDPGRGARLHDLHRAARSLRGGTRRRLLRPGRPLAPGHARHRAAPAGVRRERPGPELLRALARGPAGPSPRGPTTRRTDSCPADGAGAAQRHAPAVVRAGAVVVPPATRARERVLQRPLCPASAWGVRARRAGEGTGRSLGAPRDPPHPLRARGGAAGPADRVTWTGAAAPGAVGAPSGGRAGGGGTSAGGGRGCAALRPPVRSLRAHPADPARAPGARPWDRLPPRGDGCVVAGGVPARALGAVRRSRGREPQSLPALPFQYADFAAWQRAWLQGETLEAQLSYWRAQLEGAPAALSLRGDRPRPAVQTFEGRDTAPIRISPPVESALRALARREGVTLFMLLKAAFDVLLYRWSGQEDLCVGTPIAGRVRPELAGMVGLFVNTLVLRVQVRPDLAFGELLRSVRQAALDAYDHQELPFEKLVEELRPERDLSRTPMFQVMFQLTEGVTGLDREDSSAGLRRAPFELGSVGSKFDLTLVVSSSSQGLFASFEYSTDLFEARTVERLLGHYVRVLEEVAERGPEVRVWEVGLLGEEERRELLEGWNATAREWSGAGFGAAWETSARRHEGAVALECDGRAVTYGALRRRAGGLARRLACGGGGGGGDGGGAGGAERAAGGERVGRAPRAGLLRAAGARLARGADARGAGADGSGRGGGGRPRGGGGTAGGGVRDGGSAAGGAAVGGGGGGRRSAGERGGGVAGLRHLHLGLHGEAEGRDGDAAWVDEPPVDDGGGAGVGSVVGGGADGRAGLRHLGVADVVGAAGGRPGAGVAGRGGAVTGEVVGGGEGRGDGVAGGADDAGCGAGGGGAERGWRRHGAAGVGGADGRGAAARSVRALAGRAPRRAADECLRPCGVQR